MDVWRDEVEWRGEQTEEQQRVEDDARRDAFLYRADVKARLDDEGLLEND